MIESAWDRASLALRLLAVDPFGLCGAVVRMRAGPGRDAVIAALKNTGVSRKLPPLITDDQLHGGIDVSRTLAEGNIVYHTPYFASPRRVILPMAERCEERLAAKLSAYLDQGQSCSLVCLDEGDTEEEQTPAALQDRLAFRIDPIERMPDGWKTGASKAKYREVEVQDTHLEALTRISVELGIDSLRAPLLAARASRANAALNGRQITSDEDVAVASALVLAHRATRFPTAQEEQPEAPSGSEASESEAAQGHEEEIPQELLVDAIKAALPEGVLQAAANKSKRLTKGSGAGLKRITKRRGRPMPSKPGRPDGRNRIDIIATLRAAAPWQRLRTTNGDNKVALHPSDIRIKRYQKRSDRLLIFTVDASGSAAVARLGEAKGAVELLLADAYASRDHVALVAFRNRGADILLPPTRSLVQTKRRLAALPGGGGTPLASGLEHATRLANMARSRGMSPTLVLLTDGRANVALDGSVDRTAAHQDAERLAGHIRLQGTPSLVIDTGQRSSPSLQNLSSTLGSPYIPLPRADANRLQNAVTAALA